MTSTETVVDLLSPVGDRILVRPEAFTERRDCQIALPEGVLGTHRYFRVVAVGDGALTQAGTRVLPSVVKGDLVLMMASVGTTLKFFDDEIRVISERDIIAKVKE